MKKYVLLFAFFLLIFPFFAYGVSCFFYGAPQRSLLHFFISGAICGILLSVTFKLREYFITKKKTT